MHVRLVALLAMGSLNRAHILSRNRDNIEHTEIPSCGQPDPSELELTESFELLNFENTLITKRSTALSSRIDVNVFVHVVTSDILSSISVRILAN
jgi:hypothetical protein